MRSRASSSASSPKSEENITRHVLHVKCHSSRRLQPVFMLMSITAPPPSPSIVSAANDNALQYTSKPTSNANPKPPTSEIPDWGWGWPPPTCRLRRRPLCRGGWTAQSRRPCASEGARRRA
jgi:hypothetical protein